MSAMTINYVNRFKRPSEKTVNELAHNVERLQYSTKN